MSLPTRKTPIDRCEMKSTYTVAMLRKFDGVPALAGLADKLEASTINLLARQAAHVTRVKALLLVRVDVTYIDLIADQEVRVGHRLAEVADGKPNGRIATTLFPNGTTPIIKPVGGTQVAEMRALEGRYQEVEAIYPGAVDQRQKLVILRERYEAALEARKVGMELVAQTRAARNLAKEEFLDIFTEVANRIRAAFPRDRKAQRIFFLRERAAGAGDEVMADEADDVDDAPDSIAA